MATLTYYQITGFDLAGLGALGDRANSVAAGIYDDGSGAGLATSVRDCIHGLDWSGPAKQAADGRADAERTDLIAVADAYRALGQACHGAAAAVGPLVDELRKATLTAGEGWSFDGRDATWPVSGNPPGTTPQALQNTLSGLAQQIGDVLDWWAPHITGANDILAEMAPISAGLNATEIDAALADAKSGRLTDFDRQVLADAVRLSDQQTADLRAGKPVPIPPGQFDALAELMRSQDGATMSNLFPVDPNLPPDVQDTLRGQFGDAMRLMSTPQLCAAADDGSASDQHGGMPQLPAPVRDLLTENPIQRDWQGPYFRYNDFNNLDQLLSRSNKGLAAGSDLDRGLLKQASEIARTAEQPPATVPGLLSTVGVNSHDAEWQHAGPLLDRMVADAGVDQQAVHDFTTGDNMDVTCGGNIYNPADHVPALLSYGWTHDQHAVTDMYSFVGQQQGAVGPAQPGVTIAAQQPDYSTTLARETGSALDPYLGGLSPDAKLAFTNPLLESANSTGVQWMTQNMPALRPDAAPHNEHDADGRPIGPAG
jgi:hypothetical protein